MTLKTAEAGLSSFVDCIETELYSSDVYCQVVAVLQEMPGDRAAQAQILIKALASEAIKLTYKYFVQQSQSATVAREATKSQPIKLFRKNKKLTQAELAASYAQQRQECLRQLGVQLRQARLSQSVSLEKLHNFTRVPLHVIEALENGCTERLPEDVYVRGFIRRIGNALGLQGERLAASLPALVESVPKAFSGFYLRPIHLYIGYAALMAGAVGGLHWLASQISAKPEVSPLQTIPSPAPDVKSMINAAPIIDIAPPEMM
ncbi:MAG: helix-turn-helix domain-containing protein [Oscillatoriaceae bacterium SKW80]|nr:helix-turn-helix domain-containing protein [Oscillatoriaceae bacterium SKYG93]MCX8119326.1 helix-turn-helix domain-containing protein [Oscillatoriaceae bacterium SKW80]MDW8454793.1 helix-turn-helix domain-containing protein [Oscillatoriaceae cyanobacterium SKYGB_i_bin93]HIK28426.1 helix-turn-helix domain-containing protein [Oscillatoriaceae cyanobacterium M7585_C2015_266]